MTSPLRNITQSMNLMISAMDRMQSSANQNVNIDRTLVAARRQLALAETEITQAINQSNSAQERFNRTSQNGTSNLISQLKGLGAAYLSIQAIQRGMAISDEYISAQARLGLINDGRQTTPELQNKVFDAAYNSRGDYGTMAASVGKLGLLAGDAFSSNDETIKFTELMQKAFKVSGSSTMEQQAGMYQLTQAMAAGKLQGDEFRSIMENAPMLASAIADFAGKTKGELKKMSADGTITADIIKGALFKAADDINEKFKTMPITFSDVTTRLKNEAIQAFAPVIENINKLLNSPGGTEFISNLVTVINGAAMATNQLISGLIWIGDAVQNSWGTIGPILYMITAALALWSISMIPKLYTQLSLLVYPILAQAAAWAVAYWPILLIGAAIGFLIYAMLNWGNTTVQVIGFVGGIFGTFFAFLFNTFGLFWNMLASVAEFLVNVFIDPVYAVKKLFYDMSITVLSYLTNIAKGIENILNSIPGVHVSITSGMENMLGGLETARANLKSDQDVISIPRLDQVDYSNAFDFGSRIGKAAGSWAVDKMQGAAGSLGNMFNSLKPNLPGTGMADIPNIGKVGEVGKIKDTVDISSEDLKVMRELAEIKSIQNFVTLTPTVSVVHTGDINNGNDVDTVVERIKTMLEGEIVSSAEGV